MKKTVDIFSAAVLSGIALGLGLIISWDNPINLGIATFGAPFGVMWLIWPILFAFRDQVHRWVFLTIIGINVLSSFVCVYLVYGFLEMLQFQHGVLGLLSLIYYLSWICCVSGAIWYKLRIRNS